MRDRQQPGAHAGELLADLRGDRGDRHDLTAAFLQRELGRLRLGGDLPAAHLVGRRPLVDDASLLAFT